MQYVLLYCSALNIFRLDDPWGGSKPLTEQQLDDSINGNEVLLQWKAFAKEHPNVECAYNMLPS